MSIRLTLTDNDASLLWLALDYYLQEMSTDGDTLTADELRRLERLAARVNRQRSD